MNFWKRELEKRLELLQLPPPLQIRQKQNAQFLTQSSEPTLQWNTPRIS